MPPTPPTKPGYKTTEFWLSLAAMMLGVLFGSGILEGADEQGVLMKGIGAAVTVLVALGYSVVRTKAKAGGG